jgi:hypothetical protein
LGFSTGWSFTTHQDLRAENHPAATIPGVSMSFTGCPSGSGGLREWEEEGASGGGARFPRAARDGDVGSGAWVGGVVSPILHMSDQIISFKNTIF